MKDKKILKSGGYCTDGCQWFYCDFYECKPILSEPVIDDSQVKVGYEHNCTLFNVPLFEGSLKICNTVYGGNYNGRP